MVKGSFYPSFNTMKNHFYTDFKLKTIFV